ncbi:hypothetical protein J2Y66_004406 [Paenarthrobacter nitroguajacolicus]|uniref:hypothetical protein n=1 Tax=Paenarthrobacter TaxID=1742992 RepID=UPI002856D0FC|nr:hypothetical protein [Paenarthrobacter nitroguajacolicus]MDR6989889.1 hypothetical protein [Paenarthrobacter nitroguajacolicus]
MGTHRLLQLFQRWFGFTPGQRGSAPDDGGSGAAVVDVSRDTVRLQLTVLGQPL